MIKKLFFVATALLLLSTLVILSCRKDLRRNGNKPPFAHAGPDQAISLPEDFVTLDGSGSSDPDNDIVQYKWTSISGPTSARISDPNKSKTKVTLLAEGVHQFQLTVQDYQGQLSSDTVQVTVDPATPKNEIIFTDLVWNLWHDPDDPTGLFDEIYLAVSDPSIVISANPDLYIKVFLKPDLTSNYIAALPSFDGQCQSLYYYSIQPGYLLIQSCFQERSLIGTKVSVKIVYY